MRQKTKTKCKRCHKRSSESAARQKSRKKLSIAFLQFFRKHLVLQKDLSQQEKTSASEEYTQADESIFYASRNGEIDAE